MHRRFWQDMSSVWMVIGFLMISLAAGSKAASAEVPDVDPTGVTDPVERKFYQDLEKLRQKQRRQRQELSRQDLAPQQKLDQRRAMLLKDHKEIQELETSYQSKLSPEARTRWMERKATRQKRFEKLKAGSQNPTKASDSGKSSRKKNP